MRAFTVRELDLAAGMLPGEAMLARIQKIREDALEAGHDYIKSGKNVFYSAGGVERLAEIVRLAGCVQMKGEGKDTARVPGAVQAGTEAPPLSLKLMQEVQTLLPKTTVQVVKVFETNPQYLHALAGDQADLMTVRVRDNKNFLPGMEMEVVKGVGGVLDYCGRLPRGRGRW